VFNELLLLCGRVLPQRLEGSKACRAKDIGVNHCVLVLLSRHAGGGSGWPLR